MVAAMCGITTPVEPDPEPRAIADAAGGAIKPATKARTITTALAVNFEIAALQLMGAN